MFSRARRDDAPAPRSGRTTAYTIKRRMAAVVAVLLLGELLALGVHGTFAAFNGETDNAANSIQTGTLALETTTGSSGCESWGGSVGSPSGNINTNCGTLSITGGPFFPGHSSTVKVTVENAGSLAAGDLSMFASPNYEVALATALTNGETNITSLKLSSIQQPISSGNSILVESPSGSFQTFTVASGDNYAVSTSPTTITVNSATANAAYSTQSTVFDTSAWTSLNCLPASPSICDAIEFYVEETTSSGTPIACYYPQTSSSACTFDSFTGPGAVGTLTDFTDNSDGYYDSGQRLILTGGLGATSTRYFVLGFELPDFTNPTADNTYQGGTAEFNLTWQIDQTGP